MDNQHVQLEIKNYKPNLINTLFIDFDQFEDLQKIWFLKNGKVYDLPIDDFLLLFEKE